MREESRRAVSRVIEFGEKRWCTSGSSTKAIGPRRLRRITKSQSSIGVVSSSKRPSSRMTSRRTTRVWVEIMLAKSSGARMSPSAGTIAGSGT